MDVKHVMTPNPVTCTEQTPLRDVARLMAQNDCGQIPVIDARVASEGVDLSRNYDVIETRILNRLRRVPGVARVDLNGVAPPEINVDLILDKVKEHNVDVGSLIQKLQGSSSNLVLGQVDEKGMRYTVRAVGAFE